MYLPTETPIIFGFVFKLSSLSDFIKQVYLKQSGNMPASKFYLVFI